MKFFCAVKLGILSYHTAGKLEYTQRMLQRAVEMVLSGFLSVSVVVKKKEEGVFTSPFFYQR